MFISLNLLEMVWIDNSIMLWYVVWEVWIMRMVGDHFCKSRILMAPIGAMVVMAT